MNKCKSILIELLVIITIMTGCNNKISAFDRYNAVKNNDPEKMEGKNMEVKEELTPERLKLLKAISIDEDALDRGELKEWQMEVLRQLIYSEKELHNRYPSYEFVIDAVMPKNEIRKLTTISFTEKTNPEKFYSIELSVNSDNSYDEKDDFWTKAIRSDYEKALRQYLEDQNILVDELNVLLSGVQGREFSENMDLNNIIGGKFKLMQTIQVGVDASHISPKEMPVYGQRVQAAFEKLKLYGYYEVTVYDTVEGRIDLFKHNFNTFQFR